MSVIADKTRSGRATALLALGLMANCVPIATFAAVLPEIRAAWGLSASQAGWIGGIYFGGYAASVPILASLTDRIEGRRVFAVSSLLGAAASLAFAAGADGFWAALVLRLLGGVALAGVHMPGLKLLAERTAGRSRAQRRLFRVLYPRRRRLVLSSRHRRRGVWMARCLRSQRPRSARCDRSPRPAAAAFGAGREHGVYTRPAAIAAQPSFDGLCAGLCWQHLGSVGRARLVRRLSRLEPRAAASPARRTISCRHLRAGVARGLSGQHRRRRMRAALGPARGRRNLRRVGSRAIRPRRHRRRPERRDPAPAGPRPGPRALPMPALWQPAPLLRPIRHAAVRRSRCSPSSATPRPSSVQLRSASPWTGSAAPTIRAVGALPSSLWPSARSRPPWLCKSRENGGRCG